MRKVIVAIGGGTGLSSLLRGLKTYTSNLSVIVTVVLLKLALMWAIPTVTLRRALRRLLLAIDPQPLQMK